MKGISWSYARKIKVNTRLEEVKIIVIVKAFSRDYVPQSNCS